nr:MAG TPA: hypothetical protein [Bacteriophage sp.]
MHISLYLSDLYLPILYIQQLILDQSKQLYIVYFLFLLRLLFHKLEANQYIFVHH